MKIKTGNYVKLNSDVLCIVDAFENLIDIQTGLCVAKLANYDDSLKNMKIHQCKVLEDNYDFDIDVVYEDFKLQKILFERRNDNYKSRLIKAAIEAGFFWYCKDQDGDTFLTQEEPIKICNTVDDNNFVWEIEDNFLKTFFLTDLFPKIEKGEKINLREELKKCY